MHSKNMVLKKVMVLFAGLFMPAILIGSVTLYQSIRKLENQTLSSIRSVTNTYIYHLDESLKQIYYNNISILNGSAVQKLDNDRYGMSMTERSSSINLLREQLSDVAVTNALVDSAHLYFKKSGRIYNSVGYPTGSFDELTKEDLLNLESIEKDPGFLHFFKTPVIHKNKLAVFITSPLNTENLGAYYILSEQELADYLESLSAYQNDKYFFTAGNDFILTSLTPQAREEAVLLLAEMTKTAKEKSFMKVTLLKEHYYAFFYHMPDSEGTYIRFISANAIMKPVHVSYYLAAVFLFFILISSCLYFISIYRLVHHPLSVLTDSFEKIEKGEFDVQIREPKKSDFSYLFHSFNTMADRLKQMIDRNYTQKILLQKAELKQLQAQINPHFLYNSFFMLRGMLKSGLTDEATEISDALGSYFRYITRNSLDHVTLLDEYEHAKTYAYIQGLRFQKRILIEFDGLPQPFAQLPVPKLILQPILENAFNYGLHNKISNGLLKIHCSGTDKTITIYIEENGEELTDEKLDHLIKQLNDIKTFPMDSEMSGILNIQRRLLIFSATEDSLSVSRSALGGLCVSITLWKKMEEL